MKQQKKGEENSSQNEANQKDANTGTQVAADAKKEEGKQEAGTETTKAGGAQVAADAKKNGQNEATKKGEEKSSQNEANKQAEAAPKTKTEAPQNKNIPGARSSLLEEGETGFATDEGMDDFENDFNTDFESMSEQFPVQNNDE